LYGPSKLAGHFCPKVKGCPLAFGPKVGPIDKTLSGCPNPHFALLQKIQQPSLSLPLTEHSARVCLRSSSS